MNPKRGIYVKLIAAISMCVLLICRMDISAYADTVLKKGMLGIDVSKYQKTIDWDCVKNSGEVSFAIIRVGYGNDDTSQDDGYAEYNMSECERLNIPYGVYLFSYALSESEAYSEVEHIRRMLGGRKPPMGVYIDVEASEYYERNGLDYLSPSGRRQITDYVKIILKGISDMGCSAGYYANVYYNENVLYKDELSAYRWIAGYGNFQDYCEKNGALIWQYSNTGSINGIDGAVDMDMLLKDFAISGYGGSSGGITSNKPGWKQIEGNWYYFDENGCKTTGWQKVGTSWYYMDSNGVMAKNCWINGTYYVKSNGAMAADEWVDNGKYYVDANGRYVSGKTQVTEGWKQNKTGYWYQNADGTYPKSTWKKIDGNWYYFNASGYRTTGWQKVGNNWYYMDSNGIMTANKWINGTYYVKSNGAMAADEWVDNGKYYVDANGRYDSGKTQVTEGWKKNETGYWYQNADGTYPESTWKKIDGNWYYFNASGYRTTGWLLIGVDWYYMHDNGVMAADEWVDDNKYYVGSNGKWIRDAKL